MILTMDIGNSNTVIGIYREAQLVKSWRLATRRNATADENEVVLRMLFQQSSLDLQSVQGTVLASVVPPLTLPWHTTLKRVFRSEPLLIEPHLLNVMPNLYDNPMEVGADRIVNAYAGIKKYGAPLIVVDFGTATTLDVIDDKGAYLGGVIAPGVGISTEALFAHAAKLPRIELIRPDRVIGRNSTSSMQSGIVFGFAGQVDALVRRIWGELGQTTPVIATGGLAELIAAESETIHTVDLLLTLDGLYMIYQLQRST